jgi:hypothetical protein
VQPEKVRVPEKGTTAERRPDQAQEVPGIPVSRKKNLPKKKYKIKSNKPSPDCKEGENQVAKEEIEETSDPIGPRR